MGLFLAAMASCLVASAGCGPEPPPEPTVPVAKFSVAYERSGGLAPMPQKLVITPGRHAVATARGAGGRPQTARFRAAVGTVKRLRNGLSDPRFAAFGGGGPGNCADCYFYAIDYREHSVSVPQSDVPVWLGRTIDRLEALVEAHLPFH